MLGRKFRKLMRRRDYHLREDAETSDIIIAHSAGCWFLPEESSAKLICLVGMPLPQINLRRTFFQVNRTNVWEHFKSRKPHRFIHDSLVNLFYIARHPSHSRSIIRIAQNMPAPHQSTAQYVFIANQYDAWQQSPSLTEYIEKYNWTFISLPGSHNDIWPNADRYVAIIDHYAKLLAKTDR